MNKIPILILYLLVFLSSANLISAQNPYFDFDIECFQGCDGKISDIENNIILKLTLKNNFEYWLKFGGERSSPLLRMNVENINLNDGEVTEDHYKILPNPIYIPPKKELSFYIPLNSYNNLDTDKRVGDWSIKSELHLGEIKYYKDSFNEEEYVSIKLEYQIPPIISENQLLKFEAQGKNVEIETNPFSKIINGIKNFFINWIGYIIAGVVIIVLAWLITKKR